jgi:hypothetical protein
MLWALFYNLHDLLYVPDGCRIHSALEMSIKPWGEAAHRELLKASEVGGLVGRLGDWEDMDEELKP